MTTTTPPFSTRNYQIGQVTYFPSNKPEIKVGKNLFVNVQNGATFDRNKYPEIAELYDQNFSGDFIDITHTSGLPQYTDVGFDTSIMENTQLPYTYSSQILKFANGIYVVIGLGKMAFGTTTSMTGFNQTGTYHSVDYRSASDEWFFGASSKKFYKCTTANLGVTHTEITGNLPSSWSSSCYVIINSASNGDLFAGSTFTGTYGVAKSTDGGTTWVEVEDGAASPLVCGHQPRFIKEDTNNYYLIGCNSGYLYYSTDGGDNFTAHTRLSGNRALWDADVNPNTGIMCIANDSSGIFRTTAANVQPTQVFDIAGDMRTVVWCGGNYWLAGSDMSSSDGYTVVYYSDDDGSTWAPMTNSNLPNLRSKFSTALIKMQYDGGSEVLTVGRLSLASSSNLHMLFQTPESSSNQIILPPVGGHPRQGYQVYICVK